MTKTTDTSTSWTEAPDTSSTYTDVPAVTTTWTDDRKETWQIPQQQHMV